MSRLEFTSTCRNMQTIIGHEVLPGEKVSSKKFSLCNKSLLLTYEDHVEEDEFRHWVSKHIIARHCGSRTEISSLVIAHESLSRSYVLLRTTQPIITCNHCSLDYQQVRPEIRVLTNPEQILAAELFMKRRSSGAFILGRCKEQVIVTSESRKLKHLPTTVTKNGRTWKLEDVRLLDGSTIPFYVPEEEGGENREKDGGDETSGSWMIVRVVSIILLSMAIAHNW